MFCGCKNTEESNPTKPAKQALNSTIHIRNINTYVDRYLSGGSGQGIETFFTHTHTHTDNKKYIHPYGNVADSVCEYGWVFKSFLIRKGDRYCNKCT